MIGARRPRWPAAALLAMTLLAWGCAGRQEPGPSSPGPEPEPEAAPEAPETEPEGRPEPEAPDRYYWAYVASDGPDMVSRLRFGPGGAVFEKAISVGTIPDRPDGLNQVVVSPDADHWYLTLTGGPAGGSVWKYETGRDRMAGRLDLGTPPRGLVLTPDGTRAVITADPRAGARTATVSLLRTAGLSEARRLATCRDGRAGAVAPGGDLAYSVCRADDILVEISLATSRVQRTARLSPDGDCGPTELEIAREDGRVWVVCSSSETVLVLDPESLDLERSIDLEGSPVALRSAPDPGPMLVLLADPASLLVVTAEGGIRRRIPLDAPRPTALAVSDDGRYAFVTARGAAGAGRSLMVVVDLRAAVPVATLEVPEGAVSVAFWRSVAER